ncbi:MAG: hypothetical protein P4M11_15880 [Candidatus Pacebacteria bacterium]|nr:hypothetical protein [Candidatus Paceibacterota bacterium]
MEAYEVCMAKARDRMEKYGSYLQKMREEAAVTNKKLADFNAKMQRSEKLSSKKRQEIVRAASSTVERVKEVYNRSLIEKMPKLDKIERLYAKYQTMARLAKKKQAGMEEQWRKKRENYLRQLQKTAEMREKWEAVKEERASEVLSRRALKDQQALRSKMSVYEEKRSHFDLENSRMSYAQEKVRKLKEKEVQQGWYYKK